MNKLIKREIMRELFYSPPQKTRSKKFQVPVIEISTEVETFVSWILGNSIFPPDIEYLSYFFKGNLKEFSIKFTNFENDWDVSSTRKKLTANDKLRNSLNKWGWKQKYPKVYICYNMSSQVLFGFSKAFESIFIKNFGRKAYSNFLISLQETFERYKYRV